MPFSEALKKHFSERVLEGATAILVSFAGIATSWSGYQAALWSGIQAASYNQATSARQESTRASTEAGQFAIADINLFIAWLDAYARHDQRLAGFYRTRFRKEFTPAFDAWIASKPLKNPNALSTPFVHPEYQPADMKRASDLNEKANTLFKTGQQANQVSDNYVLNTVLLATVMFLGSIAQQFSRTTPRLVMLGVAMLMTVVGLCNFLRYPLAP